MTIGKYNVIYADPPWRYAQKGLQGAAERHYPTMGIEELCALPVAELAAPDSVLFLWATFHRLGVPSSPLDGRERLALLHGQMHPGRREPFRFSWADISRTGMGTKDFITPQG